MLFAGRIRRLVVTTRHLHVQGWESWPHLVKLWCTGVAVVCVNHTFETVSGTRSIFSSGKVSSTRNSKSDVPCDDGEIPDGALDMVRRQLSSVFHLLHLTCGSCVLPRCRGIAP